MIDLPSEFLQESECDAYIHTNIVIYLTMPDVVLLISKEDDFVFHTILHGSWSIVFRHTSERCAKEDDFVFHTIPQRSLSIVFRHTFERCVIVTIVT